MTKLFIRIVVTAVFISQTLSGQTGRRLALVIGVGAYDDKLGRLPRPLIDADTIGGALRKVGFDVTMLEDVTHKALLDGLKGFADRITQNDTIFVYYAGHGIQANGTNFILPLDFPATAADLQRDAVRVDDIIKQVSSGSPRLKIFAIDACRNNPLNPREGGLAKIEASNFKGGTFIAFAAGENQVATDGLFAKFLAESVQRPGVSLSDAFVQVRDEVRTASQDRQNPFVNDGQVEKFFFSSAASVTPLAHPGPGSDPAVHSAMEAATEKNRRNRTWLEAQSFINRRNYTKALPLFQQLAESGDSESMATLGNLYYNGFGTSQNYAEAAHWFQRAALDGETKIMSSLAILYATGRGVPQDDALAFQWNRKAAEAGDAIGMLGLGAFYEGGRGVRKDLNQAAFWYRKAAALGNATAQQNLRRIGIGQ